MYFETVQHMSKLLGQMTHWLDLAIQHAEAKKFDPNLYLQFRLAPDMLPFVGQVRIACDTVKLGSARLCGKDAPSHPDTETTMAELKARIASVQTWLGTLHGKDFEGAATRTISQPRWEGKTMTGHNYFTEHVTPNFFFHLAHTYALLRHNGVAIGKKDYLGTLTMTPAA